MATQANVEMMDMQPVAQNISEWLVVVETLPHLATKADMERQTRLLVMWLIATQIALFTGLAALIMLALRLAELI